MLRVLILLAVLASLIPTITFADGGGGIVQGNRGCTTLIRFHQAQPSITETVITVSGAWWLSVRSEPKWDKATFNEKELEVLLHYSSSHKTTISVFAGPYEGAQLCTTYEFGRAAVLPLPIVIGYHYGFNQVTVQGPTLAEPSASPEDIAVHFVNDDGSLYRIFTGRSDLSGFGQNGVSLRVGIVPHYFKGSVFVTSPRGKSNSFAVEPQKAVCPSNINSVAVLIGTSNGWVSLGPGNWGYGITSPNPLPERELFVPHVGRLVDWQNRLLGQPGSKVRATTARYECNI